MSDTITKVRYAITRQWQLDDIAEEITPHIWSRLKPDEQRYVAANASIHNFPIDMQEIVDLTLGVMSDDALDYYIGDKGKK